MNTKAAKMENYCGFWVGDKVICNGGYEGVVSRLCEWTNNMIEVRLRSGVVCIDAHDAAILVPVDRGCGCELKGGFIKLCMMHTAAPELLGALRLCAAWLEQHRPMEANRKSDAAREAIDAARAAIAKADGR